MGDKALDPGASAEFQRHDAPVSAFQASSAVVSSQVAGDSPAFSSSQPPPLHAGPRHAFSAQLDMEQQPGLPRGPFDMSAMASVLQQPGHGHRPAPYNQGQPRYNAITMSAPVSQFPAQSQVPAQQYYMPPQPHLPPQYYGTPLSAQAQPNLPSRSDLGYYTNGAVVNQQQHAMPQYYYPQVPHYAGQQHHPHPQPPAQLMLGQYASPVSQQHVDSRQFQPQAGAGQQTAGAISTVDIGNEVVRGPPRKPRQSGHAIWIGNLPPQTDLMSLVHHVCKEADGLESLFLISKSNCAFANFKDEQASVAAQRKLHDSKFLTVRLVSRLRKSTVEGPTGNTAPTGPAASTPQPDPVSTEPVSTEAAEAGDANSETAASSLASGENRAMSSPVESGPLLKDRFFILKSLTVEDIELSVRTNIWATQSHNEEALNNAFRNSDNVYLVFSANKSGEYFGYARMVSPINNDPGAAIEFAPKVQPTSDVEVPKAIPTEATEFAPKGRIIDDSARGTIFWEAERDDQGTVGGVTDEDGSGTGSLSGGDEGSAGEEAKAWGKPFRLEWLSTARLPFYRARGLRNPWNSNREVKIARDGTELEPSVGRRLIGLFNRVPQSPVPVGPVLVPGAIAYPPARPPFQ